MADTCTAFLRLFHKYVEDTSRRHLRLFHEVVLQVVPLRFVTSPDSLVAPPQLDYLRLSLEVYSRCAPKSPNMDDIACAPPLALEEPVPKTVPFKLSSDPVSPLESGRCFHIAYSHSIDRRWITVAWTDSAGRHQTSMSYCLWERGSGMSRSVVEVLGDIWGATQDILGMSHRHWQVMIAKDGPMETEEITGIISILTKVESHLLTNTFHYSMDYLCSETKSAQTIQSGAVAPQRKHQSRPFSQNSAFPTTTERVFPANRSTFAGKLDSCSHPETRGSIA